MSPWQNCAHHEISKSTFQMPFIFQADLDNLCPFVTTPGTVHQVRYTLYLSNQPSFLKYLSEKTKQKTTPRNHTRRKRFKSQMTLLPTHHSPAVNGRSCMSSASFPVAVYVISTPINIKFLVKQNRIDPVLCHGRPSVSFLP